jgi:putative membrane protein
MSFGLLFLRAWGIGGPLIGFLVVLTVVSLTLRIYMLSTWRRRFRRTGNQGNQGNPQPEEILARRFARGDIDEAEYRSRLAALRERRGPGA